MFFDDGIVKGMMKLDCKKQYMGIERVVCRSVLSRRRCWDKILCAISLQQQKCHDVKEVYLWVLEENFSQQENFMRATGMSIQEIKKEFSDSGKYLLNYALRLKATL